MGCGKRKIKGFKNIDISPLVDPDIISDIRETPWPWADESEADLIWADNVFEHIYPEPLLKVYQECHRVLKPGGLLQIVVPLNVPGNYLAVFSDPMHVNYNFTTETFDYFDRRHIRWKIYGRFYGNPKFDRIRQAIQDRFLTVELKAVK